MTVVIVPWGGATSWRPGVRRRLSSQWVPPVGLRRLLSGLAGRARAVGYDRMHE